MQTNNPVLTRMEQEAKRNGGYASFGTAGTTTAAPPVAGNPPMYGTTSPPTVGLPTAPTTPMTITDVVAKSGLMFAIVFAFAFGSWQLNVSYGVALISMLVATGLGIWGTVSQKIRPAVFLGYSLFIGIALGGVSLMWATYAADPATGAKDTTIVVQAIIGTFAAFAAMLFLYVTRIIRVTNRFRRFMMIALVGYLFVALGSLIAAIFGVGNGLGFYGSGGLGLLLCVVGVGLAAFTLALDFDAIETAVNAGAPEAESWRAGFGLVVTLVWLYLEMLRLLAILNRS